MIRPWSEHDPPMIRPHTKPSRNRRNAKVDHRGSRTDCVWKNVTFRRSAISQKRISCEASFKLHRKLPHQHNLRYHLHCGNDPTDTTHNGIPSATHPPAPLAIAFNLRERSYNYKSQVKPHLYCGTDPTMISPWFEHDPPMIRPHTKQSRNRRHRRGRSSRFGGGLCMEKHRFRTSATSQKRISCETSFKPHRQLLHQRLHCGNDPTDTKHNGMPSATHPPAPLAIPFTLRERSHSYASHWNSVDRTCTKNSWNPIYTAEPIPSWSAHHPPMIRPHTKPSRNRRTAEVDHSGSGADFVWKNKGFRTSATSQKCISCETSFKPHRQLLHQQHLRYHLHCGNDPKDTKHHGCHRQLIHQNHLQSHLHCGNDPTDTNHTGILSTALHEKQLKPHSYCGTDPIMSRPWSEHDPPMIRPHTKPSRNRCTAELDHRGSGADFVWNNIGFVDLLSLKKAFRARLPSKDHRQHFHKYHLQCHSNSFFD